MRLKLFISLARLWNRLTGVEKTGAAVAALAASCTALTERLETAEQAIESLRASHAKQLSDLRAVVASRGADPATAQPRVARSMADIRNFTGEDDAT